MNYFHARYYSHRLQRFISQDPLGYGGGDYNLYRYVHNNPHTNSDPSGLYDYGDGEGKVDTLPEVNVTGLRNSFALEFSRIRISTSVNGGGDYNPEDGTSNTAVFDDLVPDLDDLVPDLVAGIFTNLPTSPKTPTPPRVPKPSLNQFYACVFLHLACGVEPPLQSKPEKTGETYNGQATDKFGNKLGPSGETMIHIKNFPTRKRAKDAARNAGKGEPMNHPRPQVGSPHFHPTDEEGEKIHDGVHNAYPP